MKKIILSIAIAFSYYGACAQWTGSTPGPIYYNGGNVAIGTASPTKLLTIYGYDGTYNVGNQNNTIAVDLFNYSNAANIGSQINFSAGSQSTVNRAGAAIGAGVYASDANGVASYLTFLTRTLPSSSTLTERMRILTNGNVGIGNANPSFPLDIAAPSGLVNVASTTGTSRAYYRLINSGNISAFGTESSTGNDIFSGTTAYATVLGNALNVPLQFVTNNNVGMTILGNSNVGIGTKSPDQRLTVNGTIHSKEVKVDNSIPVPDYVFEGSYQLLDLTSLKAYLNANHHLPEIPSATEIETNGLSLGEMNLKLLKKVEELTLYAINQREENESLKEKQRDQEARITALEKALSRLASK